MIAVDGEWTTVLLRLYGVFHQDFCQVKRRFGDLEVWWDRRTVNGDAYEEAFWHLITKTNRQTGERLPDFSRAKRLPWCGPTITYCDDCAVMVWDYKEADGKVSTYIWLHEFDYLVILEKRKLKARVIGGQLKPEKEIAFLKTAYYVEGDQTKGKLRHKYERRES
jgi:hypothetical protein